MQYTAHGVDLLHFSKGEEAQQAGIKCLSEGKRSGGCRERLIASRFSRHLSFLARWATAPTWRHTYSMGTLLLLSDLLHCIAQGCVLGGAGWFNVSMLALWAIRPVGITVMRLRG